MAITSRSQDELVNKSVRQQIEEAIFAANGDTRQASINICALLADEFGFGEDGYFDDDDELIDLLINRK